MRAYTIACTLLVALKLAAADVDPAAALDPYRPLSDADKKALCMLFEQAGATDFDERERARRALTAFGPRVLSVAKIFENNPDLEIARLAGAMHDHVLLDFQGYLPVVPALREVLGEEHRVFIGKDEPLAEALRRFIRSSGIRVVFKWAEIPESLVIGTHETLELRVPAAEALQNLLAPAGLVAVPRGDSVVVTTEARAAALKFQTHAFDVKALDAAMMARVAGVLSAWLPGGATVNLENGHLRVTGTEAHVRLAARFLTLVRSHNLPAAFPALPKTEAVARFYEALSRPVTEWQMSGQEATRGIARLQSLGHAVELEKRASEWVSKQRPVSISIQNLPLGFCLRWLRERSVAGSSESRRFPALQFFCNLSAARIVASLQAPNHSREAFETTGAVDAGFLADKNMDGERADARVREQIDEALASELSILPLEDSEAALTVIDRKLVARGPAEWVSRLLAMIEHWRRAGKAPSCKWRTELERALEKEIDWNGEAVEVAGLIPALSEQIGVNLILALDEKGNPHSLTISADQSSLLPRGKYNGRKLLDRLCEVSGGSWTFKWGAILLSRAEAKP